jgi:hypothetical protein
MTFLFGQEKNAETLNNAIEKRTNEIVQFLPKQSGCIGRPISDRAAWNKTQKDNIIKRAEILVKTEIPELPESLYKEYYRNGNRTNYQQAVAQKHSRLHIFTIAECIENKGRFIQPLEEIIKSICKEPSWVLPAHDHVGEIYDGKKIYIDLVSSHLSCELAIADYWLGDKFSPETKKLIRENIERRTFKPYEDTIKSGDLKRHWWINGNNNWNAVCNCNVVCTALIMIDDPAKRAWYIASAENFIAYFLNGFTPDGYCSEGINYWGYGFGHFLQLAEVVYQVTDGNVDFFNMPKVKNCAMFAFRMEVAPKLYAAFADCTFDATPPPTFLKYISKRYQLGYEKYENYQQTKYDNLKMTGIFCFDNSSTQIPKSHPRDTPLVDLRTEFPQGGVMIFRPKLGEQNQLAVALKGGHNAEHHNHNDIGTYEVMYAGEIPVLDPGGEVYTARTFSNKRYDSDILNSFGHPVPIINNKLQNTGHNAKGTFIAKNFSDQNDSCTIDYAAAYDQNEIKKLERTFDFTRAESGKTNSLTVTDKIELNSDGTFETALLTFQSFEKIQSLKSDEAQQIAENEIVLRIGETDDKKIRVEVSATEDEKPLPLKFKTTKLTADPLARKKPTRLAFKIDRPIRKAIIVTKITPAKK